MKQKNELIIIDGNALLHRAWHALPPLTTKDGVVVNAVYGFLTLLFKVISRRNPKAIVVTFDMPGKTFRHEAYEEYKATRVKQPDELYEQIPILKDILKAFKIPIFEKSGFEADDVIASIAVQASKGKRGIPVIILTGDLDTLQLVNEKIHVLTLKKGISETIEYDIKAVKDRYGLKPEQLVDFKALRGDPSDNIPGVRGVGEKTASELLKKHKTLDELYLALKKGSDEDIRESIKTKLLSGEDDARESKKLVILVKDLDTKFVEKDAHIEKIPRETAVSALGTLGFRTLIERIPDQLVEGGAPTVKSEEKKKKEKTQKKKRIILSDASSYNKELSGVKKMKRVAAMPVWDEEGVVISALALTDGKTTAICSSKPKQFSELLSWLASSEVKKIFYNAKPFLRFLLNKNLEVSEIETDLHLISYLLNPGSRSHSFDVVWLERKGKELPHVPDAGGRLIPPTFAEIADSSAVRVEAIWRLEKLLNEELTDRKQTDLLQNIELPLLPILAKMEHHGIQIDVPFLKDLGKKLGKRLDSLTKEIYSAAGEEFNINSPAQLKDILFDTLKLPTKSIKKTSGGELSTAASELEKLRGAHPIIEHIFSYRELMKLKTTYVDVLPELVDKKTGRVHTTFHQTVTATGRLSSSDPNMQNIPIRGSLGNEIRKSFIAPKGSVLLAADYSQIELRIIAALAEDKSFIKAFKNNEDVHTRTAMEIWGVKESGVTKDLRRRAKAVNFGIIFGMGAHGLARSGDMTFKEAKDALKKYFEIHGSIQEFMDTQKALARKRGYVETVFGRRRYLPDIVSGIPFVRASAERMAINHPVQGTEADLIKLAMIEIDKALKKSKLDAKMLLQVHDELLFEVKKADAQDLADLVGPIMENVHSFAVPIVVNVEIGKNWGELKK